MQASELRPGHELIADERKRQIEQEGWTSKHDDDINTREELARAAACYALPPDLRGRVVSRTIDDFIDLLWPWDEDWWKPSPNDRIRELAKAGALIAAEIDRIQRWEKANESV